MLRKTLILFRQKSLQPNQEIKKKKTTKKVSHASRRTAKYAKNLKDKEKN